MASVPKPKKEPTKRDHAGLFKAGQSGNPSGRPKGSRHVFGEQFVRAMIEDFTKHGPKTIERVRKDDPSGYLSACVRVCPQEIIVTPDDVSEGTIEEKRARLDAILRAIGGGIAAGIGDRPGPEEDNPSPVRPVH